MPYHIIYDGDCNLCTTLVQALEQFDQGQRFDYTPMQDAATLSQWRISPADCAMGMILLDEQQNQWQGSAAAEEIARLLPGVAPLVDWYRQLPMVKDLGDHTYTQIRDNRYAWFGARTNTYYSRFGCGCKPPR